jgi:hypothetical protein
MLAAHDASEKAVTKATRQKRALAWKRWLTFLERVELEWDPFLENFCLNDQHLILAAFAHTVREATYSAANFSTLASATESEIPWTTWHRPSGREQNPTQPLTLTESLPTFYSNSSKAIKALIHERNNRKRSRAQFSES